MNCGNKTRASSKAIPMTISEFADFHYMRREEHQSDECRELDEERESRTKNKSRAKKGPSQEKQNRVDYAD
jgi:hypothetical protein